ncbi:uncharacterized protein LOC110924825 [Helianthus annuus]|uniref:uncharacterized protein LOC110924825 n=1 Tax=Helianthus annuus TaxID=4232 RepID=UPI000B8F6B3C|nr:uncharacterized protein LOC110924825 [Helianthus annuus]
MEKVKVEYEWKPQRCAACCLFGHSDTTCPKSSTLKPKQVTIDDEGFVTDKRKVAKYGFPQKKQKHKFVYRQKNSHAGTGPSGTMSDEGERHTAKVSYGVSNSNLNLKNSFSVLDQMADGEPSTSNSKEDRALVDDFVKQNPTEISEFMSAEFVKGCLDRGIGPQTAAAVLEPKPFKFANFLASKEGFIPCVAKEWAKVIPGKTMFSVVKKLSALKSPLRRLLFIQGNLHSRVKEVRLKLDGIQKAIDANPLDMALRESESRCIQEFNSVSYDEECFLKQKSKAEWLAAGDSNTKFFHNCVKMRNACSKIHSIQDVHGNKFKGNDVFGVLVSHYSNFLGTQDQVVKLVNNDLFSNVLDSNVASYMIRQVTREEVKSAMFSIGENKAPGPDGYTSAFFKNSWEIVGDEALPGARLKIDIQKAYDTVSWSFLEDILHAFGFHQKMVKWIMVCVTNVSYSLSINGNLYGYFKGKRGLRQGDPISPYLFTLVMEVLTLLLKKAAYSNNAFRFHLYCKKQKIINVSFVDDLFLFANGDVASVRILRDTLQLFTSASGLVPSLPKSTVYFGNVPHSIKQEILNIMPFQEGSLPVRYLRVPLISTKLSYKDCKILVDKMVKKIDNWMTRTLSFAGRLQLVNSVLSAMHIYWATVFILPAKIVNDLERCMRALVRKSLWVQWIHMYKLKGRSFWEVPSRGCMTWGWRKLLAIRSLIRPYLWSSIGNGSQTNIWSDMWCDQCPLRSFISPRRISNAGFNLQSTVAEMVSHNGNWRWPIAWYDLYPVLINVQVPILHDRQDRLIWKDLDGNSRQFSSWEVWNNIRYDRDSRDHLFFECSFDLEVWNNIKVLTNMESVNGTWAEVMSWMNQNSNMQMPENIISRLVVSAASYLVWQERNNRLFTRNKRTVMVIARETIWTVRLRLLTFKFKWRPGLRSVLEK